MRMFDDQYPSTPIRRGDKGHYARMVKNPENYWKREVELNRGRRQVESMGWQVELLAIKDKVQHKVTKRGLPLQLPKLFLEQHKRDMNNN